MARADRIVVAPPPVRKLGRYDFLINLVGGAVVIGPDGSLCMVVNFDITKPCSEMPVELLRITDNQSIECKACEIQAIMIYIDGDSISAITEGDHGKARRRQRAHTI